MGHLIEKDVYRKLGKKIDGLQLRAPWNEQFHAIMKQLYSEKEADVIVRMPYSLSNLDRIEKSTGYDKTKLQRILDGLTGKGLVIDVFINGEYFYMPSPLFVGIFEFTLMKAGGLPTKDKAKLLYAYMKDGHDFYAANFEGDKKVSIMRSLPHDGTVKLDDYVEILDYEKAVSLVEETDTFSIGNCSCRVEKYHNDVKECDAPLRSCMSLGTAAEYIIRHEIGKPASKSEMLETLAISREHNLVLNADNVRQRPRFICQCCYDCCTTLTGISKYGYPSTVVTSSFIADIVDKNSCTGCGKCSRACPIDAIEMVNIEEPKTKKKKEPKIDVNICLGCGVCGLNCKTESLKLVKRRQRFIHPENAFERIILQALERGTLQNQLFDDPGSITHNMMRAILGGFLNLDPVKKALMSDSLRSTFLKTVEVGAKIQGRGWFADL